MSEVLAELKKGGSFGGSPQFVAAYMSGEATTRSVTMSAEVGDMFFCGSYGGSIEVIGATIIDSQGQSSASYPYCVAQATSTSVIFKLASNAATRFQIGQFR